jgi:hypothetical protein
MKRANVKAVLVAGAIERARVARYIDRQAEVHEALEGESVNSDRWHAEMAKQLYELADRIRGGIL